MNIALKMKVTCNTMSICEKYSREQVFYLHFNTRLDQKKSKIQIHCEFACIKKFPWNEYKAIFTHL